MRGKSKFNNGDVIMMIERDNRHEHAVVTFHAFACIVSDETASLYPPFEPPHVLCNTHTLDRNQDEKRVHVQFMTTPYFASTSSVLLGILPLYSVTHPRIPSPLLLITIAPSR